jgi:hypothetical protein
VRRAAQRCVQVCVCTEVCAVRYVRACVCVRVFVCVCIIAGRARIAVSSAAHGSWSLMRTDSRDARVVQAWRNTGRQQVRACVRACVRALTSGARLSPGAHAAAQTDRCGPRRIDGRTIDLTICTRREPSGAKRAFQHRRSARNVREERASRSVCERVRTTSNLRTTTCTHLDPSRLSTAAVPARMRFMHLVSSSAMPIRCCSPKITRLRAPPGETAGRLTAPAGQARLCGFVC